MMEPIPIQLKERAKLDRQDAHVSFGVPLCRGEVVDVNQLRLTDNYGQPIPADFATLMTWPDGSVRWTVVSAIIPASTGRRITLEQAPMRPKATSPKRHQITRLTSGLEIATGSAAFQLDHDALCWRRLDGTQSFETRIRLTDKRNRLCRVEVKSDGWQIRQRGQVHSVVSAEGWWYDADQAPLARFCCELTIHTDGQVAVKVSIHNPNRAKHPGGLWDLGDPGSIHFGSLSVELHTDDMEQVRLRLGPEGDDHTTSLARPLQLLQESSGGENWFSRNHIDATGKLSPRFCGYKLTGDFDDAIHGDRASPTVECLAGDGNRLSAAIPHFWQNFPSALSVTRHRLSLSLYPGDSEQPYELQGGERKTQRVVLGYGLPLEALVRAHSPLTPVLPSGHYESTGALPWFRHQNTDSPLDKLIRQGLEGPDSFFRKREIIDEYGWRNFGDLFADHETLYQDPDEPLYISHYNNQYDAIYGFARQFAHSGDPRWFELMDDLARHVVDIDIYHTDGDRPEYNHGLFWHTDHYLDAHTSTHRTFTRHNDSSSTPGQLGGGPAAEHCYTSGLLYHHLLTGSSDSRNAVLELAGWMQTIHQGSKGLLPQILALKKQELPKLNAMLRGERVSPHRFPFTRGTGNYLNALLDANLLDPDGGWLEQAETVIRQTIHPADDIGQRDLLDTEIGWSYLVLLTSIARYIQLKIEMGERDDAWQFARDSFLHYTDWMLRRERPFLTEPAELEFPNDTWTAQDIRKAMLMFLAATLDPASARQYRQKGEEWLEYVTTRLDSSPERHFTRIQVILLQNYGPHLLTTTDSGNRTSTGVAPLNYQPPSISWPALLGQIAARVFTGLLHFRPAREKAWLQARLDR